MATNAFNGNGRNGKAARSMPMGNPADYPIGSPESRAAARAMAEAMKPQRSQLEDDAMVLYYALKWGVYSPDWHRPCDQRVSALYRLAQSIRDLEDEPVIPEHLRPKGPDHDAAYREAELFIKATDRPEGSDVLTWEELLTVELELKAEQDEKARSAWARRCAGLAYPKTPEQVKQDGIEMAHLIWDNFEQSATGREWRFKSDADWKPDIPAVRLDRAGRRLLPVEQVQ